MNGHSGGIAEELRDGLAVLRAHGALQLRREGAFLSEGRSRTRDCASLCRGIRRDGGRDRDGEQERTHAIFIAYVRR